MTAYTDATRADTLYYMFERGEISLDDIVAEAVSDVIENFLRTLSFVDGSDIVLPYPWTEAA